MTRHEAEMVVDESRMGVAPFRAREHAIGDGLTTWAVVVDYPADFDDVVRSLWGKGAEDFTVEGNGPLYLIY